MNFEHCSDCIWCYTTADGHIRCKKADDCIAYVPESDCDKLSRDEWNRLALHRGS